MPTPQNHLINLLPRKDRLRFLTICEPVELLRGEVLYEPGRPTRHVYFPVNSFISLLALTNEKQGVEAGMVGNEGMLGMQLVLGVATTPLHAPLHAVVQGKGAAWRVGARAFRSELARNLALQRSLSRYFYVLMTQLTLSNACLRFHQLGPRLARWLLMSQDRAHSDSFEVTHEFLADMLGVRRVGVTTAACAFQRSGLIEYTRGQLRILDRPGLEKAACSCYEANRRVYAELL